MPNRLIVYTHSPEETRNLGRLLGSLASGGEIYLLIGSLGTGKTQLVQGIGFGLGVREYACSPSFMIAREYHGRLMLYHLDLYRLEGIEEIAALGIEQYFKDDSVCAIEWAEKGTKILPAENLSIRFEDLGGNDRRITLTPSGEHYAELVQRIGGTLSEDGEVTWNSQ